MEERNYCMSCGRTLPEGRYLCMNCYLRDLDDRQQLKFLADYRERKKTDQSLKGKLLKSMIKKKAG